MTKNMTAGRPLKLILLFAIPLLVGNLFQQFYNMADTFIVGRTLGVNALAAVGCTGSIAFLIVGFAMGMTSGMSIVTAQRFGAGDEEGVRRSFAASILVCLGVTVVLSPLSVLAARPILTLLQTPPEIIDDAYRYISIILGGIGATMLFNLLSNTMRALGDSNSPLIFLVIACLFNIGLDYLFILVFNMGVAGASVATILAQLLASLLCITYIRKRISALHIRKEHFAGATKDILALLRLGFPMGFQSSIIAVGAVMVQFALNRLGASAVAAYTAAQKIDTIGTLPLMSFGITMATYVAQNHGAGKYRRIRQGVLQCIGLSVAFSVFMAVVNITVGDRLAAIFLGRGSEVIGWAHEYLIINGVCYFILGLLFIFRYSLQGLGQSLVPTVAGVMELVMRGSAAVFLAIPFGYRGACVSSPLAWLGACVPLGIAYAVTIRRLVMLPEPEEAASPSKSLEGIPNCQTQAGH